MYYMHFIKVPNLFRIYGLCAHLRRSARELQKASVDFSVVMCSLQILLILYWQIHIFLLASWIQCFCSGKSFPISSKRKQIFARVIGILERDKFYFVKYFAGRQLALDMTKPVALESYGAKSHDHMEIVDVFVQSSGKTCLQLLWGRESEW